MKPKDYIKKYNLDSSTQFNHQQFISDLTFDFTSVLEHLKGTNQLSYERFKVVVKEVKQKFDSIRNKSKASYDSFEKLWNYFYATVVGPTKDSLFGDMLKKKQERWKERQKRHNYFDDDIFNERIWEAFFGKFMKDLISQFIMPTPTESFAVLKIEPTSDVKVIKDQFRTLAMIAHPDKGGSTNDMVALIEAKNKCICWAEKQDGRGK